MLTTDTATMLARYSDWADQVLFKAMEKLPEAQRPALREVLRQMGALAEEKARARA